VQSGILVRDISLSCGHGPQQIKTAPGCKISLTGPKGQQRSSRGLKRATKLLNYASISTGKI